MTARVCKHLKNHSLTHSLKCLAVDAGYWLGPQLERQPEHICVASPCCLGLLTLWESQGSWTPVLHLVSKGVCPN